MILFYPLVLIAPALQGSSFAGHGQVSALPAQPTLQTLPASETMGCAGGLAGHRRHMDSSVSGDAQSEIVVEGTRNCKGYGTCG